MQAWFSSSEIDLVNTTAEQDRLDKMFWLNIVGPLFQELESWWRHAHSPPSMPGASCPIATDKSPISRLLVAV